MKNNDTRATIINQLTARAATTYRSRCACLLLACKRSHLAADRMKSRGRVSLRGERERERYLFGRISFQWLVLFLVCVIQFPLNLEPSSLKSLPRATNTSALSLSLLSALNCPLTTLTFTSRPIRRHNQHSRAQVDRRAGRH